VASTQSSATRSSNSRNKERLTCRSSTTASTTRPRPLPPGTPERQETGTIRANAPSQAWALSLPLATRPCSVVASLPLASAAAPSRVSWRNTCRPSACMASAATCAMPAPMMPAPTTSTLFELKSMLDSTHQEGAPKCPPCIDRRVNRSPGAAVPASSSRHRGHPNPARRPGPHRGAPAPRPPPWPSGHTRRSRHGGPPTTWPGRPSARA